jgi:transcriptional regulator with GAF, ATPase, and Fis domain
LVDNNEFFRESTLRISGSLEIEKALWQFLLYIQNIIPVWQMFIAHYDRDAGVVETVAHATSDYYRAASIKVQIPLKGRQQVEEQRFLRVRRIKNTSLDPMAEPFCRDFGCLERSCMILDLVIEHNFLGVVAFFGQSGEEFTLEHEKLIAQLNEPFAIAVSNSLQYREVRRYKELLEDDNQFLQGELRRVWGDKVVGAEVGLEEVMALIHQVAPTESPVLLLGPTGVGKELLASTIHNMSPRFNGPFIDVNCGAIPNSLMDSELFGHEKGSFTGAAALKKGRFERAQGGTVFLDEIGELTPEAQVRLLRVLQEKTINRVGGSETIDLDIRVIAATHRNLEEMMRQGLFREDLYYRLKVFPINIPTLSQRRSDIPALAHHFIDKKAMQMKLLNIPKITAEGMERLVAYNWPGNVRELENAVERALILSNNQPLSFAEFGHLASTNRRDLPSIKSDNVSKSNSLNLDEAMAIHIKKAMLLAGGKVEGKGGAAELLGINSRTLRYRMKKLGVPFGRDAITFYQKL